MNSMAESYAKHMFIKNYDRAADGLERIVKRTWIGVDKRVLQREFEDGSICEAETVDGIIELETYTPHKRFILSKER